MHATLILLFTFCQLYSSATSKSVADNEIENMLSYSGGPVNNPSNIDALFLTEQFDKLVADSVQNPFNFDYDQKLFTPKCKPKENILQKLEHLDKRAYEETVPYIRDEEDSEQSRKERSMNGARDPRGDNFMRFGRGRHDDYMRFGRSPHDDYMRFGRAPRDDYMRFGRDSGSDYLRFGRARTRRDPGSDFMRLGRSTTKDENTDDGQKMYLRYSRPENFMRLGRMSKSIDKNLPQDFMRFGRSVNLKNKTQIQNN